VPDLPETRGAHACASLLRLQGYLPTDLYNLNSQYGSEGELRSCVRTMHDANLKVIADIVINHRCAAAQVQPPPPAAYPSRPRSDVSGVPVGKAPPL